VVKVIM